MKNYLIIIFLALFPLCTRPVGELTESSQRKVSLKVVLEETAKDPLVRVPAKIGGFCALGILSGLFKQPGETIGALASLTTSIASPSYNNPVAAFFVLGVPAFAYVGSVLYKFANNYLAEANRCKDGIQEV